MIAALALVLLMQAPAQQKTDVPANPYMDSTWVDYKLLGRLSGCVPGSAYNTETQSCEMKYQFVGFGPITCTPMQPVMDGDRIVRQQMTCSYPAPPEMRKANELPDPRIAWPYTFKLPDPPPSYPRMYACGCNTCKDYGNGGVSSTLLNCNAADGTPKEVQLFRYWVPPAPHHRKRRKQAWAGHHAKAKKKPAISR